MGYSTHLAVAARHDRRPAQFPQQTFALSQLGARETRVVGAQMADQGETAANGATGPRHIRDDDVDVFPMQGHGTA